MRIRPANSEPIPGYRVRDCLGTGGCGEVWKAEAPGGLTKAIKFVYGFHNEKRAAIELKALERVKEVRHPFLLSLERIEIVDGQLIIVTELADSSLRERFNACRRDGLVGIPRLELLRYLRDAADALDYMTEQHSLQHLDVKPENLLLLSKRVKVADFGLVKNFRQVTASLMGGLTPLYAAPEVFHGSPSKCSDQYSLAIVYQELLTGLLPFQADSPAKLTLLHLNEVPDLSSLPDADRPIIARALSKDPGNRYASCIELVEALVQSSGGPVTATATVSISAASVATEPDRPGSSPLPATMNKTVMCDQQTPLLGPMIAESMSLDLPELPAPRIRGLGQIKPPSTQALTGPTLVIGAGGTAGYVLRHLRRRICERYGSMSHVPAVSMLLLDTNPQSLAAASRNDDSTSLDGNETLEMPLRRPQDYRAGSDRLLRWIGRRWLYNIPRSLKTEGLRPLGRLAFVDHYKELIHRMRQLVAIVTDAKTIVASETNTGLKFDARPLRVYLVSSICGGTGSGMVIDLAFAAQALCSQLGIAGAEMLGMLMHFTTSNPRSREVGLINAFSWLTEYDHFMRPNGKYPGDPSCGLPSADSQKKPFRQAYLTHIGDGLGDEDLMQATGPVADYIDLDLFSPAGQVLDACRNTRIDVPPIVAQQAPLRTFGVSRTSVMEHDMVEDAVVMLCRDAVLGWIGQKTQASTGPRTGTATVGIRVDPLGVEKGDDCVRGLGELPGLDLLMRKAQKLFDEAIGSDPHNFYRSLLNRLGASTGCTWGDVVRAIDSNLGITPDSKECTESAASVHGQPVRVLVRPAAAKIAENIRVKVLRLVDEPKARMPGAKHALQAVRERVQSIEPEAARVLASARDRRLAVLETSKLNTEAASTPIGTRTTEPLLHYYQRARDESVASLMNALLSAVLSELSGVMEQLVQFGRELEQLSATLAKGKGENTLPPGDTALNVRQLVAEGWRKRRAELAGIVQQRLKAQYCDPGGGLHEVLSKHGSAALCKRLRETARLVALEAAQTVDLTGFLLAKADGPKNETVRLRSALDAATPGLLSDGGVKHLVAVLPGTPQTAHRADEIRHVIDPDSTLLVAPGNEVTICYECAGLSLAHLAVHLIQGRRDYFELAARVHTRHDINWSQLSGLAPVIAASDLAGAGDRLDGVAVPQSICTFENPESLHPELTANAL